MPVGDRQPIHSMTGTQGAESTESTKKQSRIAKFLGTMMSFINRSGQSKQEKLSKELEPGEKKLSQNDNQEQEKLHDKTDTMRKGLPLVKEADAKGIVAFQEVFFNPDQLDRGAMEKKLNEFLPSWKNDQLVFQAFVEKFGEPST